MVTLERIRAEAQDVRPGRALLTALAAVLYALGWLARKTFVALWLAVAWSVVAIKIGWRDAAPAKVPRR